MGGNWCQLCYFFTIFCVILVKSQSTETEKFIPVADDCPFNVKVQEILANVSKSMNVPNPGLGLPILDPLILRESLTQDIELGFISGMISLENVQMSGLTGFELINSTCVDDLHKFVLYEFSLNNLTISGNYNFSIKMSSIPSLPNIPLYGAGPFQIVLSEPIVTAQVDYSDDEITFEKLWLTDYELTVTSGKISGLLDKGQIEEIINEILAEKISIVSDIINNSIVKFISKHIVGGFINEGILTAISKVTGGNDELNYHFEF